MKAEKLILGNIYTLDPRFPMFKAMTVKDGKVDYVGSAETAKKLCDENTKVLDYGDNFIYPGIIEGHCHGTMAGPRLAFFAKLQSGTTMDEYVDIMRQYIQDHPNAKHYFGAGWQERDKQPTADMLDSLSTSVPIVLNSVDGHSVWLNHKAMEQFGINRDSVKQWGTDIVRADSNGNPTGYISEGPSSEITIKTLQLPMEEKKEALLAWQDFALKNGITAYYEAGVNEGSCQLYSELIKEGKWKLRVYAGWFVDEHEPDMAAAVAKAKAAADKYNCEYFKIIGLKIFMDGVVEAHTAWTLEEYADKPGYTGVKRFCDMDKTVELYKEANKYGFNIHQHCIGDGAVKFAVDCIEKAQLETGNMGMRNAICHLQIVRPEDVKRMCDLNIVAVAAPLWMKREAEYYDQTEEYLGKRRAFFQYPLKSFADYSGVIAFHTDYPVSPEMSVPKSVYAAVERNNPDADFYYQLNYHEVLGREEAVAGLTQGPAYEVKDEYRLGTLRIGYIANMTVFDKDFINDPIEDVANAKIVATIIDGEEVYKAF